MPYAGAFVGLTTPSGLLPPACTGWAGVPYFPGSAFLLCRWLFAVALRPMPYCVQPALYSATRLLCRWTILEFTG